MPWALTWMKAGWNEAARSCRTLPTTAAPSGDGRQRVVGLEPGVGRLPSGVCGHRAGQHASIAGSPVRGARHQTWRISQVWRPLLDETRPDLVVHCAALANLDACEANPRLAEVVNARLPGALADETARRGIQLVHISTDAVFDGVQGGYQEEDQPNPLGVYARTKLAGEGAVQAANPRAIIARVNFYGWSLYGQRSLAEFFFTNLSAGRQVKGFTDVFFCPLLVNDLGPLLLEMAGRGLAGIYHVVSRECASKYEFGVRVARQFGFDPSLVNPCSVKDGNLVARRALNLRLDTGKLARALSAPPPGMDDGLQRFYQQFREDYPQALALLRG